MFLSLTGLHGIQVNLVSDGGSENVNQYIQHLLQSYIDLHAIHFAHHIALKTIRQSNSMIERLFRIMKSQYLYRTIPACYEALVDSLERFVKEYNEVRPHYALKHCTPSEVYAGASSPDFQPQLKRASMKRYRLNKGCSCQVCTCTLDINFRDGYIPNSQ